MIQLDLTRKQLKEQKYIPIRFYLEKKNRELVSNYQTKEGIKNIDIALNVIIDNFLGGNKK